MTADKMQQVFPQDGEIIPRLRFPEFHDAGEWTEKRLSDLGTLVSGLTYSPTDVRESGLLVLRSSNIQNDEISLDDCIYVRRDVSGANLTQPDDILICVRNGSKSLIGKNAIVPKGMPICTHGAFMTVFRAAASHFVRVLLQTTAYKKQVAADLGATINSINGSQLLKYCFTVPKPAEQQKIADFFDSLDDLIAAESRKLEALRQHKQALMQQLFPQEGMAVPRLRLPEFRDKGEWEQRSAGSLFANRANKGEEGLPIYSVTMHDGMVRRDSLSRNYHDIEEAAGNRKACKNDIAYNMMRMWQGALGVAPEDCLVSPAYVVLAPQKYVVSRFFEYLFKLPASMLLLTSYSRGLNKDRLRLYYDDFARIPLRCPSEPEQQRIADCLFSLDTHIAGQTRKLDTLRQHKQGLLQQLFPSLEGR